MANVITASIVELSRVDDAGATLRQRRIRVIGDRNVLRAWPVAALAADALGKLRGIGRVSTIQIASFRYFWIGVVAEHAAVGDPTSESFVLG